MPPRHAYHHIRHPSEARAPAGTVSPLSTLSTLSSLRTVSTRARRSLRRKRSAWERPVSPLSDTYEEEDAEAVREAVAAGVPFLEMGDVEGEGEREDEGEGTGMGRGGWGAPEWSGMGSWNGSRDGVETEQEGAPWASGDGYIAVPEGGHIRDSRGAEEQGTDEGAWRPAVDRRGAGVYETALESGWRPGYLRRRVILSSAAVFAVLLAIVEVLAGVDKARGGLGDGSVWILWGYVPTILLVVVAALWERLDFQAKRYAPWILLSQGPSRCADALLLDYANASLPTALYASIRKRHFLVLGPMLTSLMLVVGIVLSTGVFVRVEEAVEKEVPAVLRDRFVLRDNAELSFEGVDGDPVAAMLGITRGSEFPEGYIPGLAYQTFKPARDVGDFYFLMEVEMVSVRPECETATVEGLVEGGVVQTNLTVASSMCAGDIPVALNPWSTTTTGDQYHFVYEDLERAETCGDEPLVLAGVFQTRPTPNGRFEHGESAAVVCKVPFYSGKRNVTFRSEMGYTVFPGPGDDEPLEQSFLDLVHYSLRYNGTFDPVVTGKSYMMGELPPAFALAASLTPSRRPSVDDFLEGESLGGMMEGFFTTFGPLAAHYNLREDSPEVSSGTAITRERRLRVVSGIAHTMAALFGASLLLTLALVFFVPRQGIAPRCPNSVAGTASLLDNSEDMFTRLRGADTSSLETITERLRGSYYSTVELGPGMRRFAIKKTPGEDPHPVPDPRSPGAPYGYNPWPLRLAPRIASLMLIGAITGTLWALLSASQNDQGLADISDPYSMAILWTCLPAAILVALGAYLGSVDFHTRFLAPFAALYKQDAFAAGMMGTYTDELAPVTVYKASRARNWVVLLAKGAAVGATLLPILVCRVFTAEEVEVREELDIRQVEWFGAGDEAPAVDLAANGSNPWVSGDLVFPRVEVEDMKDATVEVTLPAVRAELACELLEPADGDLAAVECELVDAERDVICGQTNEHFGHVATACESTSTGEEFTGFMYYLWGFCAEGVPVRREIVSCEERVVEAEVETTLRGEELSIVKAEEDASTRRETDIVLPKEGVYDLPGATDPWFDAFFTFLSRTTPLSNNTSLEKITDAIISQHSHLRIQALAETRTSTTSLHPGTKTHRTTRLLQNRVETYLLAILLTLTLGFAGASLMAAPERVLPCSPGSIGAVAGMLAEWGGRERVVPLGAEWMGDRELARHFGG